MDRRPEPELMDSEAQTLAYAVADFSEANALFTEAFLERFPDLPEQGALIDLGCGPADICLRLAERLPKWRITGLDAGANMLRRAREAIEDHEAGERIVLELRRLPDPTLDGRRYDAVVSNSLLHHLPDPATLWRTVRQLASPGAPVQVMDLERPASPERAREIVAEYAGDAPQVLREDFLHSLHAAYTREEVRAQLESAGLGGFEVDVPSDRHWIASGTLPA